MGNLYGESTIIDFINNIDCNAKGQRELLTYGNGIKPYYEYDRLTSRFRVTESLQDLYYTYDPIANITHIQDTSDIHNTIFFRNRRVEPSTDYKYDATYRLIEATGREHLGQSTGAGVNHPSASSPTDETRENLPQPGDSNAMGNYLEQYLYDYVGNILKVIHSTTDPMRPQWNRMFSYKE